MAEGVRQRLIEPVAGSSSLPRLRAIDDVLQYHACELGHDFIAPLPMVKL